MFLANDSLVRLLRGPRTICQHDSSGSTLRRLWMLAGASEVRSFPDRRSSGCATGVLPPCSPPQALTLNGGLARTKSAFRPLCSVVELFDHSWPRLLFAAADREGSSLRAARLSDSILPEHRDVAGLPPWALENFSDCTNIARPNRSRVRRRRPSFGSSILKHAHD